MDLVLIMVQMPLCGRQWEPAKHRCSQLQKPSAGPASKSFNPIFDSLKQATRWDVNASRAKGQEGQWCSSTPPRDKKVRDPHELSHLEDDEKSDRLTQQHAPQRDRRYL